MTGHMETTGHRVLAARCRDMADQASLDRRAWLCLAVIYGTRKTTTAVRQALADIPLADVRTRAEQLLDQLHTRYGRSVSQAGSPNHVQRSACRCGTPPDECVPDDSLLTQHAWKAGKFRNAPRVEREVGLSMLIGDVSVEDATRHVLMGKPATREQLRRAVVRLTRAGKLRKVGFAIVHTPGRITAGRHVTVVWRDDDPLNHPEVPWPPAVSDLFDTCFNDEWEGDGQ